MQGVLFCTFVVTQVPEDEQLTVAHSVLAPQLWQNPPWPHAATVVPPKQSSLTSRQPEQHDPLTSQIPLVHASSGWTTHVPLTQTRHCGHPPAVHSA